MAEAITIEELDRAEDLKKNELIIEDEVSSSFLETFRAQYLQSTIFQLIIFVLFLVVLSIVTFGMASSSRYHMTRAISMTFTTKVFSRGIKFEEMSSVSDIWEYLEEVAVPELFILSEAMHENASSRYTVNGNLMLGVPRLKQIRVRNDSCKVHHDFRALVSACYSAYSETIEDKQSFGLQNSTAWVYHSEEELESTSYWGILHLYSGAGSYEDLGEKFKSPFIQLTVLRDNFWISLATRIVVLDFTLYNINVNLFSVVKLVMELPPTGGVLASHSIRTVNLLRYVSSWDRFILAMEIVFCFFTLYYLFVEIIDIYFQGIRYFLYKWNWVDSIILTGSIICIAFGIYRTVLMNNLLKHLLENPDIFANFDHISYWQTQYDASTAILVFLSWVKIFKYLSFNETMIQLSTTIAECAKDVAGFAVMFFIMFLAYAQLGYLLFGSQLLNFSRLETSIFTLMRLILGDFDYVSLERANRIMGPIYFVTFVFFVFIILLNMFLAILSDTYANVKAKMEQESINGKFKFMTFLSEVWKKIKNTFKRKNPNYDIQEHNSLNENRISTSSNETEPSTQKIKKMQVKSLTLSNDVEKKVSQEDFERLSLRVDDLRHEMDQIQTALLAKLNLIGRNFERLVNLNRG